MGTLRVVDSSVNTAAHVPTHMPFRDIITGTKRPDLLNEAAIDVGVDLVQPSIKIY